MRRIGFWDRVLVPTYNDPAQMRAGEIVFDYEKCSGCSVCAQACPAATIVMEDQTPRMKTGEENECIFCGDCMAICPEGAIRLTNPYRYTRYFKTIDAGETKPPRL